MDTFELKMNAGGSWSNAGRYLESDAAAVKAACETLANTAQGKITFKIMRGASSEYLDCKSGALAWREV